METTDIKYKSVKKPFTMIEDHIILPKELVDQLQKILEDAIATSGSGKPVHALKEGGDIIEAGRIIKIALDTDKGFGIGFFIDIAPRGTEEVQKDKI